MSVHGPEETLAVEKNPNDRVAFCRGCGEKIRWRLHWTTGKLAPLNWEPDPGGNCVLLSDNVYRVVGKMGPQQDPNDLYLNHFSTCAKAKRFTRRDPRAAR